MSTPETRGNDEPHYSSVSELLRAMSAEWNRSENEGRTLREQGDISGHHAMVRARAQMLVDLPEQLRAYQATGGNVPDELQRWAADLSGMTRQAIQEDSILGMSSLLRGMGSTYEDPDALEAWATRLEPPAPQ